MKEPLGPLVSPGWLEQHLDDPRVRVVQCDMNPDDFRAGHIPGAVFWHSMADLLLPDMALNLEPAHIEALLSRSGIEHDSILVFSSCWTPLQTYLKWIVGLFGHTHACVLDGGSPRWKREMRPLEHRRTEPRRTSYRVSPIDHATRAFGADVRAAQTNPGSLILDVRSPQEFVGEWFMIEPPVEGERSGHIEGALHLPFEMALYPNETFKDVEELRAIYAAHGVTPDLDIITYCAVGARSAHTWFVLSQLLGFPRVRNYDGSWNQWSRDEAIFEELTASISL